MSKKKRTSFSISDDALVLLKKLAEKDNRSGANMIETLIFDAAKRGDIK